MLTLCVPVFYQVNEKPIFVPGIWGPMWSTIIPGMWSTEGGQSAAGKLVGLDLESRGIALSM